MRTISFTFIVAAVMMFGCSNAIIETYEVVSLEVDKTVYSPNDSILVTLRNETYQSIFLDGCSQFLLATPVDTGWQEQPIEICVWEGIMGKLKPGGVLRQKFPARPFIGQNKFVVRYATGCLEGKPRSEAQCGSSGRIESRAFTVYGEENLILNVRCVGQELRATVFNQNPDQTYFANLGDGFNSSLDQERLYIAEGTGGYVERLTPDGSWLPIPRPLLVEGSRFVALRPRQTYQLVLPAINVGKIFRLKIEYFDQIDPAPGATPRVDYSTNFDFPCQ